MPEYRCTGGHDRCAEMLPCAECPHCEKTYLRDPVVAAVVEDLLSRSEVGQAKYGVTLARTDLKLRDWLQHAYEEALDEANYLKRAIMELDGTENWLGAQIRGWVEGMQPTDLRNRSTAELQDELQRRLRGEHEKL